MSALVTWWSGMVRRRWGRLVAAALGIATAVALLAALGEFLLGAQAAMTDHALRSVAVDWQVQAAPGADQAELTATVTDTPGVRAALPVEFASTPGFAAVTTGATGQTGRQATGAGQVLGLPPDYRARFPGELRTLAGADTGVLLAQQTAANLHAQPGDTITVGRAGLVEVTVRVDGVVDLPLADSLFQVVGAQSGAQPTAPPDNVLLLPAIQWHQLFDPLADVRPDQVRLQLHTVLDHALPSDPATAYTQVIGAARNLEARAAGAAQVGDNLAAALGAARSDAAYARILFLFLGLPGAALAALLTWAVTSAGADRRRGEQAMLRLRGATGRVVLGLAVAEAVTVAVPGSMLGLAAGFAAVGHPVTPTAAVLTWAGIAMLVGLLIAVGTVIAPAVRDWRRPTVAASRRRTERRGRSPLWLRFGLDIALLAGAALVLWAAGSSQYQLVLAPEGAPTISVSYWAFAAPAMLWLGGALLAWRLADLLLGRGWRLVGAGLRPVAGILSTTIAGSLARRRPVLIRSIVLVAVAIAFAMSTAVFNQTYRAQAEVDAQLTNGADVTVSEPPGASTSPDLGSRLAAVPGVRAVEPIQHRFGYVGNELQDLYGVRPDTIPTLTALQDSYFPGSTAAEAMSRLASKADSVLVSAETVKDYQLRPGDQLTVRLPDARTGTQVSVSFHYAGVVAEFPTAPKDSFLIANAGYVAARTGSDQVGAYLIDTGGTDTGGVAGRIRGLVGTSATVTDIATVRGNIGSSLTAVDLAGLTRIELVFALLFAAGAAGLVLALSLNERRRGLAITRALGGTRQHLRAFIVADTAVVLSCGLIAGVLLGWGMTALLVTVLTGVFDPPPAAMSVPWSYLATVAVVLVVAQVAATMLITRLVSRDQISAYRDT